MIWFKNYELAQFTGMDEGTIHKALGIEITALTDNSITGKMPVDERTKQPAGILHGGASVVLAESLGSIASNLVINPELQYAVGQSIQANHIRPGVDGYVYGTAEPIHLGKKTHIWEIRIVNDHQKLVCICRLTMAILDK
jgi:1,4-dihydroxy-2-naphthoyl-CoA hydrolase